MIDPKIEQALQQALASNKHITFLVGAGLSAASGIPTFRDKEGYWTVGSKNYQPEETGTYAMFKKDPIAVWKWFIYRKTICEQAQPNTGHDALTQLERLLQDRFALVTQNVDGLHAKAGTSDKHSYYVHGHLNASRCGSSCSDQLYDFPNIRYNHRDFSLTQEEEQQLKCPNCGDYLRPHVLWFDESYNEKFYKLETVRHIADHTGILFIIGTSGATYLPSEMIDRVQFFDVPIVDININYNYFTDFIMNYEHGHIIKASSSDVLPQLVDTINGFVNK